MYLGDIIRQHRINLGISQKEMAQTIGVTYSFLCKVEKNEKKISLDKLGQISRILDLKYDDLKVYYYCEKINMLMKNEANELKNQTFKHLLKK